MATEILKDWDLFVNEDKADFTHVYQAKLGVKEEQGKLNTGRELWRKSITLGFMLCSKEDITRQISLGYMLLLTIITKPGTTRSLDKRLLLYEAPVVVPQVVNLIKINSALMRKIWQQRCYISNDRLL